MLNRSAKIASRVQEKKAPNQNRAYLDDFEEVIDAESKTEERAVV